MYLEREFFIYREFREGHTEDVIFEEQLKGGEVGSPEGPWGELPCKGAAGVRP